MRRLLGLDTLPRLVVAGCVAALLAALAVTYPDTFRDVNDIARANASLDLVDRELGGGNSVIPDTQLLVEARGWIPEDETFAVAVGERRPEWTDLTAGHAEAFAKQFLLPRRQSPDARWLICLGCDLAAYPGAAEVWSGEGDLSIMRLPS